MFRAETVTDNSEIYELQGPPVAGDQAPLTRPVFDAMRAETSVFVDAYAAVPEIDLRVDGRTMAVTLVTGNFFQVVRVAPMMGRALTPADDERSGGNPVIVLSHKGWDRHFKRDPNVIGRTLLVRDAPFEIIGVTPEGFRGLAVGAPDFWAPLAHLSAFQPQYRGRENEVDLDIIGRLRPDVPVAAARAQLTAWYANRSPRTEAGSAPTLDLAPQHGTIALSIEETALFAPLFVAFGLI